jgi:hypothetical protein
MGLDNKFIFSLSDGRPKDYKWLRYGLVKSTKRVIASEAKQSYSLTLGFHEIAPSLRPSQ